MEYKTQLIVNGETQIIVYLYDDEIEKLLAFVNKLQDIHKGLEIKESDK